jgi:hypothetical protein
LREQQLIPLLAPSVTFRQRVKLPRRHSIEFLRFEPDILPRKRPQCEPVQRYFAAGSTVGSASFFFSFSDGQDSR